MMTWLNVMISSPNGREERYDCGERYDYVYNGQEERYDCDELYDGNENADRKYIMNTWLNVMILVIMGQEERYDCGERYDGNVKNMIDGAKNSNFEMDKYDWWCPNFEMGMLLFI